jgi:hypothetical protein
VGAGRCRREHRSIETGRAVGPRAGPGNTRRRDQGFVGLPRAIGNAACRDSGISAADTHVDLRIWRRGGASCLPSNRSARQIEGPRRGVPLAAGGALWTQQTKCRLNSQLALLQAPVVDGFDVEAPIAAHAKGRNLWRIADFRHKSAIRHTQVGQKEATGPIKLGSMLCIMRKRGGR